MLLSSQFLSKTVENTIALCFVTPSTPHLSLLSPTPPFTPKYLAYTPPKETISSPRLHEDFLFLVFLVENYYQSTSPSG